MQRRETPLGTFGGDAQPTPPALTVAALVRRVADTLGHEPGLRNVWVEGEVLEARLWSSGHLYFTLADEDAQVRCVMWADAASKLDAVPAPGDRVLARGTVSLYQRKGETQFTVRELRAAGQGAAAAALEALRKRLQAEGLFAAERKRPLPRHPAAVGVVTSLSGAVLHDILDVTGRRHPTTPILVCGVRVQGETAAAEIAAAVARLGASGLVDVLVVARGGGGADDLSAFNDEAVVRAVAACPVPVVSAVGHETDVTLTDFAADVRAPTPSAAAELVVPPRDELLRRVDESEERLRLALARRVELAGTRIDATRTRADGAARLLLQRASARLAEAAGRLEAVSPLATLARGYAVVSKDGGAVVRASSLTEGDRIVVKFQDGTKDAEVR